MPQVHTVAGGPNRALPLHSPVQRTKRDARSLLQTSFADRSSQWQQSRALPWPRPAKTLAPLAPVGPPCSQRGSLPQQPALGCAPARALTEFTESRPRRALLSARRKERLPSRRWHVHHYHATCPRYRSRGSMQVSARRSYARRGIAYRAHMYASLLHVRQPARERVIMHRQRTVLGASACVTDCLVG